jgi:hypothetical protein
VETVLIELELTGRYGIAFVEKSKMHFKMYRK